ncbi:MAG: zf-HC2 domain-containing protein [Gemmatimonadota bacterium]|nr:MAG: zf-HC2 domain-containing protein [Gemmatimonadota bacterium]
MTRNPDCEVFQDQLDALQAGALPEEGIEQLRLHAASCGDCAMLLRVHEHLAAPALGDLEAAVPDEMVASVWPRVRAEIATGESVRLRESRGWQGWSWLAPAVAAATLLLFIGSGLMYQEVRELRRRETALVQQVAEQERWLAELDLRTSTDPVARTAGLAGRPTWERALARRRSVSVAELARMLGSLPATTTIFDASDTEALYRNLPSWLAAAVENLATEVPTGDGLQAGELTRLVETLGVDSSRRISTTRLLALAGGSAPGFDLSPGAL